jgi:hypothetical protein
MEGGTDLSVEAGLSESIEVFDPAWAESFSRLRKIRGDLSKEPYKKLLKKVESIYGVAMAAHAAAADGTQGFIELLVKNAAETYYPQDDWLKLSWWESVENRVITIDLAVESDTIEEQMEMTASSAATILKTNGWYHEQIEKALSGSTQGEFGGTNFGILAHMLLEGSFRDSKPMLTKETAKRFMSFGEDTQHWVEGLFQKDHVWVEKLSTLVYLENKSKKGLTLTHADTYKLNLLIVYLHNHMQEDTWFGGEWPKEAVEELLEYEFEPPQFNAMFPAKGIIVTVGDKQKAAVGKHYLHPVTINGAGPEPLQFNVRWSLVQAWHKKQDNRGLDKVSRPWQTSSYGNRMNYFKELFTEAMNIPSIREEITRDPQQFS